MRMTLEQRREGLAQVHDLRRRLAEKDFPDVEPDEDAEPGEVFDLESRRTDWKGGQKYDAEHPVMLRRRRDIDG